MRYVRSTILGVAFIGSVLALARATGADDPPADSGPAYWKKAAAA